MFRTLEVEGLNLERLLRLAAQEGITLRGVARVRHGVVRVGVPIGQGRRFAALCAERGWAIREVQAGLPLRVARLMRRRPMLPVAAALCLALVWGLSRVVLAVRVEGAAQHVAQVRAFLREEGVRPGVPLRGLSPDALRGRLALRLPGLAFTGVRLAGSTVVVQCAPAAEGEIARDLTGAADIVAAEAGIVTRIAVASGTPQVQPGQAVRRGQVLIAGQERTGGGLTQPVRAQGDVIARVYAKGEARVRMEAVRTVETGQVRTRVWVQSPWHSRAVQSAPDFDLQDVSVHIQPVVGLYLPLWRRIETLAQTVHVPERRALADAASQAQGAAERQAKLNCPTGVEILDKWVEYSMIDDEYVYATVVLAYERSIAGRLR